ncbi:MAG: SCO family protein [Bdellovibrionales bacterium]|jgi:cytochrome oxidase Cu insertion factor (SCO1/SenC/PrrC family)|nr:SCO family protein [Bdellovibrionales bacterium]
MFAVKRLVGILLPWLLAIPTTAAIADEIMRTEAKGLYKSLPDIPVQIANGQTQPLSSFWKDKPVLLTLFYRRCSGSCSPFLMNLKSAVEDSGGLGDFYQVVALSFDPRDTLEDLQQSAATFKLDQSPDWHFAVADAASIAKIADTIGFWFKKIPTDQEQFDHPSMIAAIRDGKIVRVLVGTEIPHARMRDLIYEVKGVFVPFLAVPGKDTIFRCFKIDPKTGTLRLDWGILILMAPALLAALIGYFIFRRKPAP